MLGSFIQKKKEKLKLFILPVACLWILCFLPPLICSAANVENKTENTKKDILTNIETKWGIRPIYIRLTAAERFLDFRFRVIDPDKAALMMKRGDKAYLIDQESGAKMPVPVTKVGPLRQTGNKPKAGKVYPIMFANTGGVVKQRSRVTLVIGDFRIEDLIVGEPITHEEKLSHEMQTKLRAAEKVLRDELVECVEDCGGDSACRGKCEKAFRSRMDKEYQKIIYLKSKK